MTRLLAASLIGFCLLASGTARAEEPFTPAQRQAIEGLIERYILEHPEVILQAVENLERRRKLAEEEQQKQAIGANREALNRDRHSVVAGNPEGDVTVVEFFDYRCGYCKQAQPQIAELLKQDGKVRMVLKEFPILGPESVLASRAAIASRAQGKYLPFHDAMMALRGTIDEAAVLQTAAEVGLDVNRLKTDMQKPEVDEIIKANYALAQALGIQGTPAFVIGDALVPGAAPVARLRELVREARSGCATC